MYRKKKNSRFNMSNSFNLFIADSWMGWYESSNAHVAQSVKRDAVSPRDGRIETTSFHRKKFSDSRRWTARA